MAAKKTISKHIRLSEENLKTLERVVKGLEARQRVALPELAIKTTQTDAIIAALTLTEKLLIQEGHLKEN